MALEIFKDRTIRCRPGAPYLWLKLPEHWRPGEFTRARRTGHKGDFGTAFAIDRRTHDQAVRGCLGGGVSREGLRRALVTLDALLDELPGEDSHSVA